MLPLSEVQKGSPPLWQPSKENVDIQLFSDPCTPEVVVKRLAAIEGPMDVYCWYEGERGLPESGALFMRTSIFEPLFAAKSDAKLCLYSLSAWNFTRNVSRMAHSTPLGVTINAINIAAVECFYSSSFFRYCAHVSKQSNLYTFIQEMLPQKRWLIELSASQKKIGKKIGELFDNQTSLFDCVKDFDVCSAYSLMQYVEGYYLIRESVRTGLQRGQKKITVAFVLPNDEGKYYLDFKKDIQRMLTIDFGNDLIGVDITITFQLFQFGESLVSRPYIDKKADAKKVKEDVVGSYFDYLTKQSIPQERLNQPMLRDVIHNLNDRS